MIVEKEITRGQPIPNELRENLNTLLKRLNKFAYYIDACHGYHIPLIVTSGYRTPEHNAAIGGAKRSCHCQCMAVDIRDRDGKIKEWVKSTVGILEKCDLYMEHPSATPNWVHLDIRKRQNRIFKP